MGNNLRVDEDLFRAILSDKNKYHFIALLLAGMLADAGIDASHILEFDKDTAARFLIHKEANRGRTKAVA